MQRLNPEIRLTRPLAFIDTEWTDLDPDTRRIVSIAITRCEPGGNQESRYWLVNPRQPISPESSEIHGITREHVANQPEFRKIAREVEEMLQGADLAGYNIVGDIEILEKEMDIANTGWTATGRKLVDAYRLWQVREPRTLSDAHRRFVGPVPEDTPAHDARNDVSMTIAIVGAMHNGKTVGELHNEANPGMADPAGKFRKQDGQILFNFGPYRGQPAERHPEYLEWMLSRSFAPSTQAVALDLLRKALKRSPFA